jgi:hypothetical protein
MSIRYTGTQSFTRQAGSALTFDERGVATQQIEFRGAAHRLRAFRTAIPPNSPDFPSLQLAKPPDERDEGGYVSVLVTYTGRSDEVEASYDSGDNPAPGSPPTVERELDFIIDQAIIAVPSGIDTPDGEVWAEVELTYRSPYAAIDFVHPSFPDSPLRKSQSGITAQADPGPNSILAASIGGGSASGTLTETAPIIQRMQTDLAIYYRVATRLETWSRRNRGQIWQVRELYRKFLVQNESLIPDD